MDLREIDLRIVDERVLILRVAALPAELREAARPNEKMRPPAKDGSSGSLGMREAGSGLADAWTAVLPPWL